MSRRRCRLALSGVLALALSVTVGMMLGDAATAAKKKKKKGKVGGTVDITRVVNAPIPDAAAGPPATFGTLVSTISVPASKQFRGTRIRDVNVTLQTGGTSGASPADNLQFRLTAPDGTTTWLVGNGSGPLAGTNIGPLTFDDETAVNLGGLGPAPDSTTLVSPYVGTAQPNCFSAQGACSLAAMDNGNATGTWTLRAQDGDTVGETSNLVLWRLTVSAGRRFKTK